MARPSDLRVFLKEARSHWHHTGALAPSSKSLARAITGPLARRDRSVPARICEVGPGTGSFTREIVSLMGAQDILDVYDLNQTFLGHTRELLEADATLAAKLSQVSFHELDARRLDVNAFYDVLISGLPFNNFSPEIVDEILAAYVRATRPDGTISFFEYAGARTAKKMISRKEGRTALDGIDAILKRYIKSLQDSETLVLANFPPAVVHHFRRR
ncbi:MAG: methyltransferase domain-containing protein [Acidobacteriota bacterium]